MNTRKSSVRLATYTTVHSAIDRLGNVGEKKMALLMYSEEVSSAPPVWTDLERPRESNLSGPIEGAGNVDGTG